MKTKIASIFKMIYYHQITDEELYKSKGNFPVFTAKNEIKGYWNKKMIEEEDIPCISYPVKGNQDGYAFVQNEIFDANNTAVLIPYPEWREKINLEWITYKLRTLFLQVQISKEGVSYINKEIVEEYEIDIPDEKLQLRELNYYRKLNNLRLKFEDIENKINTFKNKNLILNNLPDNEIILSEIMDYVSRNDELSEEGLYTRSQGIEKVKKKITVISGSTDDSYGEIPFDSTIHSINNRPCLQVITRGRAGNLRFLPCGNYATNTNSLLLLIKEKKLDELNIKNIEGESIYLKFLEVFLQPFFSEYCSSADLSVFPLTDAIKEISIPLFRYSDRMKNIVKKYDLFDTYRVICIKELNRINELFSKELVI